MTTLIRQRSASRADERLYYSAYAVSAMGTGLVYPLTAIYMVVQLRLSAAEAGLCYAAMVLSGILVNPFAGRAADRRSPARLMVVGLVAQCAGFAIVPFGRSFLYLLAALATIGVGNGIVFTVRTPVMVEIFGRERLSRVMGRQFGLMNAGLGVAGLGSATLVTLLGPRGYSVAFLGNGATYLVLAAAITILVRRLGCSETQEARRMPPLSQSLEPLRSAGFRSVLLLQVVISLFVFAQLSSTVPVMLLRYGHVGLRIVAGFFTANCLAAVALQPLAQRLSQRIGNLPSLVLALSGWAACDLLGLVVVLGSAHPAIQLGLIGLFAVAEAFAGSLVAAALQPIVAARSPAGRLGVYAGATAQAGALASMAGPGFGFAIMAYGGVAAYWLTLAAGTAIGIWTARRLRAVAAEPQPGAGD